MDGLSQRQATSSTARTDPPPPGRSSRRHINDEKAQEADRSRSAESGRRVEPTCGTNRKTDEAYHSSLRAIVWGDPAPSLGAARRTSV
jgi:hypothetical protein